VRSSCGLRNLLDVSVGGRLPRERENAGRSLTMEEMSTFFQDACVPDSLNATELFDRSRHNKGYRWQGTLAGGDSNEFGRKIF